MDKLSFEIESGYMVISDPERILAKTEPTRYIILAVGRSTWSVSKIEKEMKPPFHVGRSTMSSITLVKEGFENKLAIDDKLVMGYAGGSKNPIYIRQGQRKRLGKVDADGSVVFCDLLVYGKDEGIEDHELWDGIDISDEPGERFFSKMCNITTNAPDLGCFKGGVATSTGYDGIYKVYGRFYDYEIVEITINFR